MILFTDYLSHAILSGYSNTSFSSYLLKVTDFSYNETGRFIHLFVSSNEAVSVSSFYVE